MARWFPGAVESAADFPRFCSHCGRPLAVEDRVERFDAASGHPILVAYAYCRGNWLERLLGTLPAPYHDSFVVSPRPPVWLPPAPLERA